MSQRTDSLVGGATVISALTFISRLLGVVRDCACAAYFGAGLVWDAFSFAFRIPNLFRRLFGEGALSAAFVPVLSEYLELRDQAEAERMSGRVAGALLVALLALLLGGELIVLGLWRYADLSVRWRLALALTAVMLPYMVFICMTALAGAALNSLRHFAAPAAAPIVLNVCWIVAIVVVAPRVSSDPRTRIFVVACAILVAGALQLALQVLALRRKGFRLKPVLALAHPEVRRVGGLMLPVALGMAAFQLNVLLDGVIAISLAAPPGAETFRLAGMTVTYPLEMGANSVLYYASRLMQLPLGVFGIAVATAAFPMLSAAAARKDWDHFAGAVMRSLRLVLFVGLPAGVGLILVGEPAVQLVFERGAFTADMTARAVPALAAYATAIWAYCALHVLVRAFYGLGHPALPARVAAWTVLLNLALNLALVWPFHEAGMAAATAACACLQVTVLYLLLRRRVPLRESQGLARTAWQTVVATSVMALACRGTLEAVPAVGQDIWTKLLRAGAPTGVGLLVFVVTAAALGSEDLSVITGRLRRLVGRRDA